MTEVLRSYTQCQSSVRGKASLLSEQQQIHHLIFPGHRLWLEITNKATVIKIILYCSENNFLRMAIKKPPITNQMSTVKTILF